MDSSLFPLLLVAAGVFFFARNLWLLRNPEALRHYVTSTLSTRRWLKKYGEDGAMKMARARTLPVGMFVATCMLAWGGSMLWRIHG
jgi:hypothetical protein